MTIVVDAIYENGVLKPKQAVDLTEGAEVWLAIHTRSEEADPFDAVIGICSEGPGDGAENHDKYIYGKLRP